MTNDLTLFPQAQRDNDGPDLGFHYDPLDYAFGQVFLQNASVTVLPGTAIGTFANASGYYSIALASGSTFNCQGSPVNLNRVVRCNLVQEQANTNWTFLGESIAGPFSGISLVPQASFRFTDWSRAAQESEHFKAYGDSISIYFADCQFHGGKIFSYSPTLYFTNCLFERVYTDIDDDLEGVPMNPVLRNNLFFGGTFFFNHYNGGYWLFRDNMFDHAAITQGGTIDNDYDGYVTGSAVITNTGPHDFTNALAYDIGPLGSYYLPTNSPFLDNGSVTNSGLLGFYHYTSCTNEVKEGTTRLNLGFHYMALNSSGQPVDSDNDLVPDYLEDLNGNNVVDSGETDWNSPSDLGLKVLITRPRNSSIIP